MLRLQLLLIITFVLMPRLTVYASQMCSNLNQQLLSNLAKIGLSKSPWVQITPDKMNIVISDTRTNLTYIYSTKASKVETSLAGSVQCANYPNVVVIQGSYSPELGIGDKRHALAKIIDPELTYHVKINKELLQHTKQAKLNGPVENVAIDLALHEAFHICTTASAGIEKISAHKVAQSLFKETVDYSNKKITFDQEQCESKDSSFRAFLADEFADLKNLQVILKKWPKPEEGQIGCQPQITPQIDLMSVAIPIQTKAIKEIAIRITERRNKFKNDPLYDCLQSVRDHERLEGSATFYAAEFGIFQEQEKFHPLNAHTDATFNHTTAFTYLTGHYLFKMTSILAPNQKWQEQVQAGEPIDIVLKSILSAR